MKLAFSAFKVLGTALAFAVFVAPKAQAELEAGFAGVDMTPPWPVPLAGYSERQGGGGKPEKKSTGVHDAITAKAAVFRNRGVTVAFVATDLCLVTGDLRALAAKKLDAALDLPLDHLNISGTHTHNGPGGLFVPKGVASALGRLGTGSYDEKSFDFLATKIAEAISQAHAALKPASIGFARAEVTTLTHNRGIDGGPVASDLMIARICDLQDRVLGLLVNFAIHGTCIPVEDMSLSGDVGGAIWRAVEKKFPGATCLFLNADEGDIRPAAPEGTSGYARCERIGALLAERVVESARLIEPRRDPALRVLAWEAKLPPGVGLLGLLLRSTAGTTRFQAVAFDDEAFFAAIPGEMVCESGARLKAAVREAGFRQVFLVGLCNDHFGYFTHPESYQGEHKDHWTYEKQMNPFGEGAEKFFVEEYRRASSHLARAKTETTPAVTPAPKDEDF